MHIATTYLDLKGYYALTWSSMSFYRLEDKIFFGKKYLQLQKREILKRVQGDEEIPKQVRNDAVRGAFGRMTA